MDEQDAIEYAAELASVIDADRRLKRTIGRWMSPRQISYQYDRRGIAAFGVSYVEWEEDVITLARYEGSVR